MRGISLTERQDEALEAIRYHIKRYGMPPSRSELGKALKIGNQAGVDRILSALAKEGLGAASSLDGPRNSTSTRRRADP